MGDELYVNYAEIFKLHFPINFKISSIIFLVKIITVTLWPTNPHATRAFGTSGVFLARGVH
jgi:hypothetical protein